jgi:3-hydroxyisobutyrate dehydrogenase-like beta-hydroxyacid dehydrogenase
MGVTVGAALKAAGARVLWASAGRGEATRSRAADAGFEDAVTLARVAASCEFVFSVCPPHAALEVSKELAAEKFAGRYVDANAISPEAARQVKQVVEAAGARFIDGGIIGPPARSPGTTRIYLSGPEAEAAARLFDGSLLEAEVVAGAATAASALKMAYAAWTKGSAALLLAVRALARAEAVEEPLLREWGISQPGLKKRSDQAAIGNAFKAWRFVAEMDEIARTFGSAGLPDGFHRAAAEVYARLKSFKDHPAPPAPAEVIERLLKTRT